MKRSLEETPDERPLSPPPTKRKVESSTTNKAVSNFFTPASKKEPQPLIWRIVEDSLLVGMYGANDPSSIGKKRKVAAFDFDSTLIRTSSGNVFGKDIADWKWWHSSVPSKLKALHSQGYLLVILSNQAGIILKPTALKKKSSKAPPPKLGAGDLKRLADFKAKAALVLAQLNLPLALYAATARDGFRKPRTGMWREMVEDHDLDVPEPGGVDLGASFFVGDAGGRPARKGAKADHSCSDRDFAANVGISFHTPEEYFLGEAPAPFARAFDPALYMDVPPPPAFEKRAPVELVLLCGSPGAGKSTFYWEVLRPLGYERINQDILKTRDKCLQAAATHLTSHRAVAVDNTNADPATRAVWLSLAAAHDVPARCIFLDTPAPACRHNDAVRALAGSSHAPVHGTSVDDTTSHDPAATDPTSADPVTAATAKSNTSAPAQQAAGASFNPEGRAALPDVAFRGFAGRFREPSVREGFAEVLRVPFGFRGSAEMRRVWGRYWI